MRTGLNRSLEWKIIKGHDFCVKPLRRNFKCFSESTDSAAQVSETWYLWKCAIHPSLVLPEANFRTSSGSISSCRFTSNGNWVPSAQGLLIHVSEQVTVCVLKVPHSQEMSAEYSWHNRGGVIRVSSCSTNPGWEFLSSPLRCAKEARDNWMLTERLTLRDNRGWFYYPGVNHTGNAGMPCILEGKFLSSLFCLLMPLKRKHVTSLGHRPLVFQAPEFCLE